MISGPVSHASVHPAGAHTCRHSRTGPMACQPPFIESALPPSAPPLAPDPPSDISTGNVGEGLQAFSARQATLSRVNTQRVLERVAPAHPHPEAGASSLSSAGRPLQPRECDEVVLACSDLSFELRGPDLAPLLLSVSPGAAPPAPGDALDAIWVGQRG